MTIEGRIDAISQLTDSKDQITKFCALISETASNTARLQVVANNIFAEDIYQQVVTKAVVLHIAKVLEEYLKSAEKEEYHDVTNHVLMLIKQSGASSYDDADLLLRTALFEYHLSFNELSDAAQILSGVNLDSTTRPYTLDEKADIYIKCAEAYLENDDSVEAETLLNKASPLMSSIAMISMNKPTSSGSSSGSSASPTVADPTTQPDQGVTDARLQALELRYRVTYARVLDSNRKFVEAALRYYELSKIEDADIVQAELENLFCRAVTCIILGKTGNQRSRVMALIAQDEDRLSNLERLEGADGAIIAGSEQKLPYSQHAKVLLKMHREQILRSDETRVFSNSLMPHQRAITKDGFTTVDQAVMEHNMLAVAKVYDNISFTDLSLILHLTTSTDALEPSRVQKIAAGMITEGRLYGSIDQTEGRLEFKPADIAAKDSGSGNGHAHGTGDMHDAEAAFNVQCGEEKIKVICKELSEFEDMVLVD